MRSYYSAGEFDRLMFAPLVLGLLGMGWSGWDIASRWVRGGGFYVEPGMGKFFLGSLALAGCGALLVWIVKPTDHLKP